MKTLILQKLHITRGDKTRKPRLVWSNPIAWREAKTKASAARASVLRYGFIFFGLGGALAMLVMVALRDSPNYPSFIDANSYNPANNQLTVYAADGSVQTLSLDPSLAITFTDTQALTRADSISSTPNHAALGNAIGDLMAHVGGGRLSVNATPITVEKNGQKVATAWSSLDVYTIPRKLGISDARKGLLGATIVEFAVILLIVTNAAASTVTREKEDGTLDLLLSTPITSRYYIWGKLRGLVSFVLPLVAVPVASAGHVRHLRRLPAIQQLERSEFRMDRLSRIASILLAGHAGDRGRLRVDPGDEHVPAPAQDRDGRHEQRGNRRRHLRCHGLVRLFGAQFP